MSGDRGSVSGVLVCWSLDLGSTPDGSLSFSFPLDHLGLSMLTTKLNKYFVPGHTKYVTVEHRLDCTGEGITLRLDGTNSVYSWTCVVDLSMRSIIFTLRKLDAGGS